MDLVSITMAPKLMASIGLDLMSKYFPSHDGPALVPGNGLAKDKPCFSRAWLSVARLGRARLPNAAHLGPF